MYTRLNRRLITVLMLLYAPLCRTGGSSVLSYRERFGRVCKILGRGVQHQPTIRARPSYEAGQFDGFVSGVALAELQRSWCPKAPYSEEQLSAIIQVPSGTP